MKKIRIPRIHIPVVPVIIFFLCLAFVYGMVSWVKTLQLQQKYHKDFRGNIENLYYYLKKEPANFEMYAVLNKGDSVAISVWANYISTSDETIKKYEKQLKNMKEGILPDKKLVKGEMVEKKYATQKYPEYFLVAEMQKAMDMFKKIRLSNQDRIEMVKGFNEPEYQKSKKELNEFLKKIVEDAKKVKLDLR